VKIEVSLCSPLRHGGGGGSEGIAPLFLILAVVRSEWSAYYRQYFTPRERAPVSITKELGPKSQTGCFGKNIHLVSKEN